jgi:hypothetical protein
MMGMKRESRIFEPSSLWEMMAPGSTIADTNVLRERFFNGVPSIYRRLVDAEFKMEA